MKQVLLIYIFSFLTLITSAQHHNIHAWFDASNTSYIDLGKGSSISKINSLSNSDQLTISLWIKWGSKNAAGVTKWANLITLSDSTGSGDNGVFWVQHSSDNKKFEFAITTTKSGNTTRDYITSTTQPVNGTWYHITCVYDGSLNNNNMKIYVNGNQEASMNKKGNIRVIPATSKLNIGRWSNPGDSYRKFNGSIDEITILNTALTKSQIQLLMANSDSFALVNSKAASLVSYFNFENQDASDLASNPSNGIPYSGVSFFDSDNSALPIDLIDFYVENNKSTIDLNWSTATEKNNDFFTLERSYDGLNFMELTRINGAGNSNSLLNYHYSYTENNSGVIYFRLKQTDYDGNFSYSKLINSTSLKGINDFKVFPNPVSRNSEINVTNLNKENITIRIFDLSGILKMELYTNEQEEIKISSENLLKGIYILQYVSDSETSNRLIEIQ